ncbi:MAG: tRNA(Ile)-lysidine synthase [Anaerolineales bacterium]|nr:tRNA(Ile)-lysidine synthase [Anaerolineales bacterium]
MDILERVRATIDEYDLFHAETPIVVGVSGGPDSLTLLHVLLRLRDTLQIQLHVGHLDHAIRTESAEEAAFVARVADDWGLPATIERQDVPAQAEAEGFAIEQAARRARYRFLARIADQIGVDTVAVGHNADDQVETVLMHLIRGSGLAGLRGMQPKLPYPPALGYHDTEDVASRLALVRPLLEVPRSAIQDYCEEHDLNPRFDRSNLDTTFFRNRLRHELISELETYNPNIREVLRRTARVIADEYDYLRQQRDEAWGRIVTEGDGYCVFDLAGWEELHVATQRSLVRQAIRRLRRELRDIDWVHVENALEVANEKPAGSEATLPAGLALFRGYETLTVGEERPLPDWPLLHTERLRLKISSTTRLPRTSWQVAADVFPRSELGEGELHDPDPWHTVMDGDAAGADLSLRRRQAGDQFQPLGMGGHTKSLADFMIGEKIPHHVRDRLPVVVNADDEVVWLPGWRLDERVKITEATARVLRLHFTKGSQ